MKIGFIGLGNMGAPMARNLIKAGHELLGFDVAPTNVGDITQDPITEIAKKCSIIFSMLPDGNVLRNVYEELIPLCTPKTILVDCSTVDVESALHVSKEAEKNSIKPFAKLVSWASVGLDPSLMGLGPIEAIRQATKKANWNLDEIDLFEINEAFAAQTIAVISELAIDEDKVNVNGGAIALGHPIGASGARILVTLIHEMQRQNKKKGCAALCIGGGMGIALCVEKI